MKSSTRLILTVLAAVMLLAGTLSVVFADPNCVWITKTNDNCNYNGCNLALTVCAGTSQASCPMTELSSNESGNWNCYYAPMSNTKCNPALNKDGTKATDICMYYEECQWDSGLALCQATMFFDSCLAPYYMNVLCPP